jgi:hypothetical protein
MRALCLVLLALGCGKSNPVTPPGTVLAEWDASQSSRPDFATATIGPRAAKDFTVTLSPKSTPPFKLVAHVETATVDYSEGGAAVHQQAPVAIKIVVMENTGWELSGKCLDGPHYQMPSVGPDGGLVTPLGMIQDCRITHRRRAGLIFTSEWQLGFTLSVHGDGTVAAFPPQDARVE